MNAALYIALGAGVGLLIGLQLRGSESFCCQLVSDAGRDKVKDNLGSTAASAYDLFNVGGLLPPFLQATGIRP